MGIFGRFSGQKEIEDYKIDETVKCTKCETKMYLPKEVPAFSQDLLLGEGGKCNSCGKHFCGPCLQNWVHTEKFQCCSQLATKGIKLVTYIDPQERGNSTLLKI
jgi:hypothetical protein